MLEAVLGILVLLAVAAAVALYRRNAALVVRRNDLEAERASLRTRLGSIVDVEAEAERLRGELAERQERAEAEFAARQAASTQELAAARAAAEAELAQAKEAKAAAWAARARVEAESRARQEELSRDYTLAKETYDRLIAEVALVEESLEHISFGVYRPHYDFATSEGYKAALERAWQEQKDLIKSQGAVHYGVAWTIGDSRREGERMQKQYGKLLLRAFNGECDASVAKISWNNAARMEARIRKSFDAINELGGVMQISVTPAYRDLRLQELWLHHEHEEKKRAEAEEQRRLREQMREEERAQRELERAKRDAEEEERRQERALAKARAELARARDDEAVRSALRERIQELEGELELAHQETERAVSQAMLTRSGHVYVISNIGSFGEEVVKIGMTRRLDPRDRIKELGDASVPFDFDIHGMVFSEDAPALEAELHRQFADRRINLVNHRREFFRVTVGEVDSFLRSRDMALQLTLLAEAREYRESIALRNGSGRAPEEAPAAHAVRREAFPAGLFRPPPSGPAQENAASA